MIKYHQDSSNTCRRQEFWMPSAFLLHSPRFPPQSTFRKTDHFFWPGRGLAKRVCTCISWSTITWNVFNRVARSMVLNGRENWDVHQWLIHHVDIYWAYACKWMKCSPYVLYFISYFVRRNHNYQRWAQGLYNPKSCCLTRQQWPF